MAFRAPGQPVEQGAAWGRGTPGGAVFARGVGEGGDPVTVLREPAPIGQIGESQIARADRIRGQAAERIFRGAPKFWRVTNRAQEGHVKVWMGAFNGEVYPEGATDDKRTWLKPGESMLIPLEAGLHFFGNVFDPRLPEAADVVERFGGLELETEEKTPGKNAPVRVIGGPIGLPDMLIEPIDGRMRAVGAPVAVYELYWNKLKSRGILHRPSKKNPEQREIEREELLQRAREYQLEDQPIYEDAPLLDAGGRVVSTAATRGEIDPETGVPSDAPDMRVAGVDDPEDEPPKT